MSNCIILGLQHGDEGKGKITLEYLKRGTYDACVRFNGGPNAGHTVYHNGHKFVIHQLPTGCIFGVPSLIGPGCVVDPEQLDKEYKELLSKGIDIKDTLYISKNAHIITSQHIEDDKKNDKIGSTKKGIAYCYSDKCLRKGVRANETEFMFQKVDAFEWLQNKKSVLFEGAQGWELDIDHGDYPFVTSSNCGISAVANCGVVFEKLQKETTIVGVAKVYETYVGAKTFQGKDKELVELQKEGNEFGATTGRIRQCNWLNLDRLKKAILMNGVNCVIFNKVDILKKVGKYKLIHGPDNELVECKDFDEMKKIISECLGNSIQVIYSESPYKI